jgi:hypothetical protein
MSTSTARDLIEKAMQKIGVLAEGETPTAQQAEDGLDALNLMLESWAGSTLLTSAQIQETFSLVSGTATYSIGANQTFNSTKPFEVTSAFVRDSANNDTPLDIVSRELYDDKGDKTSAATPAILFYDPGATQQANQTGTVKLYPTPDASYSLVMTSEKPFTAFTDINTSVTFAPGYKRAIIYNLAIELAPEYGATASAEVVKIAKESLETLENINIRNKETASKLHFPGQLSGGYNIETDQ